MSNITEELNKIKHAVYGREVRQAIHDGIKKAYDDASKDGNANMEVELARGVYNTLNQRLNASDERIEDVVAEMLIKGEVSVHDINKNLGKLDETYMSDEFLQQMAGDTPIHSRPAGLSITTQRHAFSSVTPDKTSFIKQSSNLYNEQTSILGKYIDSDTGEIKDSEINKASNWINVIPNQNYTFYGTNKVVYYDLDGEYIGRESAFTSIDTVTFETPSNCYFIRIQVPIETTDTQVNLGVEKLTFEPYYNRLDGVILEESSATSKVRTPLGQIGIYLSKHAPNIDLKNRKIAFHKNFFILVNDKRYDFWEDGVNDTLELNLLEQPAFQYVYFNIETEKFELVGTRSERAIGEDDVLIMVLSFDDTDELLNVFCTRDITVNGFPYRDYLHKSLQEKSYYFVPEVPYYDYEADTLPAADGTGDFDHHNSTSADVYAKYDELIDEHSDYITKTELGKDASGELPIYKLELNPETAISTNGKNKLPTLIIVSGIHGDGDGGHGDGSPGDPPTSVFSLYYLVREICENWQSSKALEYLRWNVNLVIIPIANPWGFNNKSRYNSNGVDINRNFDSYWSDGSHSGSSPFSESETRYIQEVFLENESALVSADYHTIGGSEYISDNKLMRYFISGEATYRICEQTLRKLSRIWKGEYDLSDEVTFYGMGDVLGNSPTLRGWSYYKMGIPSVTLEGFLATDAHREKSGSVAMTMNVEHLGNWLMNAVRYFYSS